MNRILVPTDFSDPSDAALEYARFMAQRFGATWHLLHVMNEPLLAEGFAAEAHLDSSMREGMIRHAAANLRERAAGSASADAVFGDTAATVTHYASELGADLIVMGTHGRTGFAHLLLGSVAEQVVRTAECPVLTVPQRMIEDAGAGPHPV